MFIYAFVESVVFSFKNTWWLAYVRRFCLEFRRHNLIRLYPANASWFYSCVPLALTMGIMTLMLFFVCAKKRSFAQIAAQFELRLFVCVFRHRRKHSDWLRIVWYLFWWSTTVLSIGLHWSRSVDSHHILHLNKIITNDDQASWRSCLFYLILFAFFCTLWSKTWDHFSLRMKTKYCLFTLQNF